MKYNSRYLNANSKRKLKLYNTYKRLVLQVTFDKTAEIVLFYIYSKIPIPPTQETISSYYNAHYLCDGSLCCVVYRIHSMNIYATSVYYFGTLFLQISYYSKFPK